MFLSLKWGTHGVKTGWLLVSGWLLQQSWGAFLDSVKAQPRMLLLFLSPETQAALRSQEVKEPLKQVPDTLLLGDNGGLSRKSPSHNLVKYARYLAGPEVLGREASFGQMLLSFSLNIVKLKETRPSKISRTPRQQILHEVRKGC